jgi:hypothetical protein
MKKINAIILLILTLSCKKENVKTLPIASLTLINTITGGNTVKLGSQVFTITNNSSSALSVNAGENDLYVWPVGDSLHPYYTYSKFNSLDREIYSLFLGGTPTAVDGILIKENIPYRVDSTGGIRFINLSPNSPPLNINLSTIPSINEVNNLAYKQYTDFKSYPGLASTPTYTFQIKNASTGTVLLTYTVNPIPRFANITLVIRGMVGTTPALGVTRVTQDR